jgi:hypothetical protein
MNAYDDLRAALEPLDPMAGEHLRNVLIHDQVDRDAISSQLLRTVTGEATAGPRSSTS